MSVSFASLNHQNLSLPRSQGVPRSLSTTRHYQVGGELHRHSQHARFCRVGCRAASEEPETESPEVPSNSLFSDQFSATLKEALGRQGQDALTSGEAKPYEEPKPSAAEEVLSAALQDARRNLLQLENIIKALTKQQEREQKQFERLHFAYKRAKGDAAYIRSCEKRLEQAREKN